MSSFGFVWIPCYCSDSEVSVEMSTVVDVHLQAK